MHLSTCIFQLVTYINWITDNLTRNKQKVEHLLKIYRFRNRCLSYLYQTVDKYFRSYLQITLWLKYERNEYFNQFQTVDWNDLNKLKKRCFVASSTKVLIEYIWGMIATFIIYLHLLLMERIKNNEILIKTHDRYLVRSGKSKRLKL